MVAPHPKAKGGTIRDWYVMWHDSVERRRAYYEEKALQKRSLCTTELRQSAQRSLEN